MIWGGLKCTPTYPQYSHITLFSQKYALQRLLTLDLSTSPLQNLQFCTSLLEENISKSWKVGKPSWSCFFHNTYLLQNTRYEFFQYSMLQHIKVLTRRKIIRKLVRWILLSIKFQGYSNLHIMIQAWSESSMSRDILIKFHGHNLNIRWDTAIRIFSANFFTDHGHHNWM